MCLPCPTAGTRVDICCFVLICLRYLYSTILTLQARLLICVALYICYSIVLVLYSAHTLLISIVTRPLHPKKLYILIKRWHSCLCPRPPLPLLVVCQCNKSRKWKLGRCLHFISSSSSCCRLHPPANPPPRESPLLFHVFLLSATPTLRGSSLLSEGKTYLLPERSDFSGIESAHVSLT
jgi:hypothetical protein